MTTNWTDTQARLDETYDRQFQASRRMTVVVEVNVDGQWEPTLHPSEAAARYFEAHTDHETRRLQP